MQPTYSDFLYFNDAEDATGDGTDKTPYLNITYDATNTSKSGLIPTTVSAPFYTNASSNPLTTASLSEGESETVTFWVNATGDADLVSEFFGYANLTSDETINNETAHWNVTIISDTPVTDTSFTVSLPIGYTEINFSANNKTVINLDADGQDTGTPIIEVTNTGNVNLDIYLWVNESPTGFTLFGDTDNNPAGSQLVNNTEFLIASDLATSSSQNTWLWVNWSDKTPQRIENLLNVSVQETT